MNHSAEAVFGYGSADRTKLLCDPELFDILAQAFSAGRLDGKRVLLVIPDGTRTMPMGRFFKAIHALLHGVAAQLDVIIALGTHRPMTEAEICAHLGFSQAEHRERYPDVRFFNHTWDDPASLYTVGTFGAEVFRELSLGTINQPIPVAVNRIILNYDVLMVCGPVFPHEVVGFSGGSKYFFPGIGAPEFIHATHWTAAVQSCRETIGRMDTPIRALIETAADWLPQQKIYCCAVVRSEGVYGLFAGAPFAAWQQAAALSRKVHIMYIDRPFKTVFAEIPPIYEDIWTAGKGMFKLEQAVADGGELILYAPWINSLSLTHGSYLEAIGYHCRDYYIQQWDRYQGVPWSILSHSVNVTGAGSFEDGVEKKRISVTLATGISEERCRNVDLKYRDPQGLDPESFKNRAAEGCLSVPYAGETLYRPSE